MKIIVIDKIKYGISWNFFYKWAFAVVDFHRDKDRDKGP